MNDNDRLILSEADLLSPTWAKLKLHIGARIEALRNKLEGATNEADSNRLRGRIKELRALIEKELE